MYRLTTRTRAGSRDSGRRSLSDRGRARAARCRAARPHSEPVLHPHHARRWRRSGKLARGLRWLGSGRPAGLRRHRRLRDVRGRDPLRLESLLAIPLGGIAALLLAIRTAFSAFRLQGAYFAIGTWVMVDVCLLLLHNGRRWRGHWHRCRARPRYILGVSSIRELFAVREAAARDNRPIGWRWRWSWRRRAASTGCYVAA